MSRSRFPRHGYSQLKEIRMAGHGTACTAATSWGELGPPHVFSKNILFKKNGIITAWWCNNHLKKYEFVNGKDDIPYMKWKIKNVPNHKPD